MTNKLLIILYATSPVLCNWVYLHIAQQVTDSGERLLMVTDRIGFDPTLPIIGAMFFVRDLIQQQSGRITAIAAIVMGTITSAVVTPSLALASGGSFLISELIDMAVYTTLHRRRITAIAASGIIASVTDTLSFLWIAFGSFETWESQVTGKIVTTIVCAIIYGLWRGRRSM